MKSPTALPADFRADHRRQRELGRELARRAAEFPQGLVPEDFLQMLEQADRRIEAKRAGKT